VTALGSNLLNVLLEIKDKVDGLIKNAKKMENIEDETLEKAIDLINEILRMLDDLGDRLIGLAEEEEEEEESI